MKTLFCLYIAAWLVLMQAKPNPTPISIEKIDLFASRGWTSSNVTVLGFRLGMGRAEAFRNAKERGLKPREGMMLTPCKGNSCSILSSRNLPTGVDLLFDDHNNIREINISPGWGAPDNRSADLIARRLPGRTGRLMKRFNPSDLITLLGKPNKVGQMLGEPPSFEYVVYEYDSLGVRLRIQQYTKAPHEPWFYDLEFVKPSVSGTSKQFTGQDAAAHEGV